MRAAQKLEAALRAVFDALSLPWPEKAVIEPPKNPEHGDLAANVALVAAKAAGVPPRELAARVAEALRAQEPSLTVEVAGPGFLNIRFAPVFWHETVRLVEEAGERFGMTSVGAGKTMQVEFVSANPTGPLHIGHGRGAAVGDSLARVLRFAGYDVKTEYYLNDAGVQMRTLGLSVWLRALELCRRPVVWPASYYKGDYIIDIARDMLASDPALVDMPEEAGIDRCYEHAMKVILDGIRSDLSHFRVHHDEYFSEKSLVASGAVESAFAALHEAGLTFEEDGALWFRTTEYGDDKDRVLRKSDGTLTYFASDIAYHHNKYQRGFDYLVDIWGADHHGYVPRMRAAVRSLGRPPEAFDVVLIQMVSLLRDGVPVSMSTRGGEFETLSTVVNEVGVDATRFMFLSRKSDSQLEFDLELVKQRSMENPVYYVQYAHARVRSVLRKAAESGLVPADHGDTGALAALNGPEDLALLRHLDRFEDVTAGAAQALAVHQVSHYLMDLAGALHGYYARHPVLQAGDDGVARARLALLRAVGRVLGNGLDLLGVSAPESM